MESLLIRTDASTLIGIGHVMRCLALAQAWQDQGAEVTFISHCESDALRERIIKEGFQLIAIENPHPHHDLSQTLEYLKHHSPKWLVLDGYHFTPEYQKSIHGGGCRLLIIDDMNHQPHYHADILLNQNIHAPDLNYHCDEDTILLLGTRYVLLRREFRKYQDFKRQIPDQGQNILVTLGGSDSENVTLKAIQVLNLLGDPNIKVKVVVGPANPNIESLQEELSLSRFTFDLLPNGSNMPELMAWADLAVSGGGSTSWELAFMGLPNIIIVLAENQHLIAQGLEKAGAARNLGWHVSITQEEISKALSHLSKTAARRKEMSRRGRELVDGMGADRVSLALMERILSLRPMSEDDVQFVWELANDPEIRAVSFSSKPVPWEDHVGWFESKLKDENCLLFLATGEDGVPFGQIRYDRDGSEALVSVSLAKSSRGRGYGSAMLRLASRKVMATTGIRLIHAYIKQDNDASKRAFMKAGFKEVGRKIVDGQEALHLTVRKDKTLETIY